MAISHANSLEQNAVFKLKKSLTPTGLIWDNVMHGFKDTKMAAMTYYGGAVCAKNTIH